MEWFIVGACVVGAWSVLRIIGDERQREIERMNAEAAPKPVAEEAIQEVRSI